MGYLGYYSCNSSLVKGMLADMQRDRERERQRDTCTKKDTEEIRCNPKNVSELVPCIHNKLSCIKAVERGLLAVGLLTFALTINIVTYPRP